MSHAKRYFGSSTVSVRIGAAMQRQIEVLLGPQQTLSDWIRDAVRLKLASDDPADLTGGLSPGK